jgi:hypothetical protein
VYYVIKVSTASTFLALLSNDSIFFGKEHFGVDALLEKIPTLKSGTGLSLKNRTSMDSEIKMRRCPACGCVTPQAGACIECGYSG